MLHLSSVQFLSCVWLFATPWTAACQASLSITKSRSLFKLMTIESVMPSNHLILCHSSTRLVLSWGWCCLWETFENVWKFPIGLVVRIQCSRCLWSKGIQSLVWELKACRPCGMAEKKKTKKTETSLVLTTVWARGVLLAVIGCHSCLGQGTVTSS